MKKWLKRIRGAVGMGLTWAVAWSGVGGIYGLAMAILIDVGGPVGFAATVALYFAAYGFVGGSAFSVVLGIAESRRRFDQMSLPRFAAWGAAGGLLLSVFLMVTDGTLVWLADATTIGVMTMIGAGSAAGSLALARRADDRDSLQADADVADIGLTKEEKRALLGR